MMKVSILILILSLFVVASATGDDLYKVSLHSFSDAQTLKAVNTDIVLAVSDGYLALANDKQSGVLRHSGLDIDLLASGVRRDQLALDGRMDRKNSDKFEVLYEDGRLRLLLAGPDRLALADEPVEVFPLRKSEIPILYQEPSERPLPEITAAALEDIQTLIDRVEQDSLEAYLNRLQAFYRRVTGTDSNYAARDYIASKFTEFGYDSVYLDPFTGSQLWERVPCQSYNVIAVKVGSVFPEQQIIIGGHFDAVPNCPGADDNATGTAATMECARILKDVDTKMTFIFIAFDSEESGIHGAYHYAEGAVARNDDIVFMVNCDMIAHFTNTDRADLYTGGETAYGQLWDQLGNDFVGINADLSGSAGSDHLPFQLAGYDVIFVQEKWFSSEYHQPTDSTTYLDFEYMTRMVQATLATLYTVDQYPPPIRITSVQEPGDGQSQLVNWQAVNPDGISYFRLSYYRTSSPLDVTTIDFPSSQSSYTIEGMTEGEEYVYYVQAYDALDQTSFAFDLAYSTPSSIPAAPAGLQAMPIKDGIEISWAYANTELDFSHCSIVRDGEIIAETLDNTYIDDDPTLGADMHYYYVVATDNDGNSSDTVGIDPVSMKAATLDPERILAVNRTQTLTIDFVDETKTGVFMREALQGYDFQYYSDTAALTCGINCVDLDLIDLIDYGVLVIGTETGRSEDLALTPNLHGILHHIAYYLSIGGKVLVFGRWGDLSEYPIVFDYDGSSFTWDDPYHDFFHIDLRVQTPTLWDNVSPFVSADLIGAQATMSTYPHLRWDSVVTVEHATSQYAPITEVSGIPCASFVQLVSDDAEVIYTYDSRYGIADHEGQPVAWRYFGEDYSYVFFDIPLSCFERDAAIGAFRQAIDELMTGAPESPEIPNDELPQSFALYQNYPNPFNPFTRIEYFLSQTAHVNVCVYNVLGQKVATVVDEVKSSGTHVAEWYGLNDAGKNVATGIYLYQMKAGGRIESKKMLLVK